MNVVHLTDSPFFGGPERQMLGLSRALPSSVHTTILCFRDHGSATPFMQKLTGAGVSSRMIDHANPHFVGMVRDVVRELRRERADVLVCHGYKADVIGWLAAKRVGVPILSVSRGWTGHTKKVRVNEAIDRFMLRLMDKVVCVSQGQADKVLAAGVRADRVTVIHNSIDTSRFDTGDRSGRELLQSLFPSPRQEIVLGVGRLSPEKGFDRLIQAARVVVDERPSAGFVLVGDGPDRALLEKTIRDHGLEQHVILAGFRNDVDRLLLGADILAQSSYTEGLPNVVLEACAAGVPVVATNVGGTGEVIEDGRNGFLVPAGDHQALATRILDLMRAPEDGRRMGEYGQRTVKDRFSFSHQSAQYVALLTSVAGSGRRLPVLTNAQPETHT